MFRLRSTGKGSEVPFFHPELAEGSVGLVKLQCSKSDIDVSASLNIEKYLVPLFHPELAEGSVGFIEFSVLTKVV
ncbi:hypothetical protein [Roseivirga thermotolerans]|uniref:hypothetical protein n=1 Tax=Roseivirga thermotolerans TaxID=1758176 RepID=UPI00273E5EFC|nr:hypothetical protein [Roseivirga thermotolerans]